MRKKVNRIRLRYLESACRAVAEGNKIVIYGWQEDGCKELRPACDLHIGDFQTHADVNPDDCRNTVKDYLLRKKYKGKAKPTTDEMKKKIQAIFSAQDKNYEYSCSEDDLLVKEADKRAEKMPVSIVVNK